MIAYAAMLTLVLIAATCWRGAPLAIPRAPRRGDEVQALIHRRLIGRHQALVAYAAAPLATTLALLLRAFAGGLA